MGIGPPTLHPKRPIRGGMGGRAAYIRVRLVGTSVRYDPVCFGEVPVDAVAQGPLGPTEGGGALANFQICCFRPSEYFEALILKFEVKS